MIKLPTVMSWMKNIKVPQPNDCVKSHIAYAESKSINPMILVCFGFLCIHFSKPKSYDNTALFEV